MASKNMTRIYYAETALKITRKLLAVFFLSFCSKFGLMRLFYSFCNDKVIEALVKIIPACEINFEKFHDQLKGATLQYCRTSAKK